MSLNNITLIPLNQTDYSFAAISAASLPTNQAFVLQPPKSIPEVFGERVVYPLLQWFGSLFQIPGAQGQEIDACQPYFDEYIETVNKLEALEEVGKLKGEFLAEQNTLDALMAKYQEKYKDNRKAAARYVSPRWIGDTAKNNAEKRGKKDNDYQIAIEASYELDSYSINENDDPLRFVANANIARQGSKKNKEMTFEKQMAYQIASVFSKNAEYLQNIHNNIVKQQTLVNNRNITYQQKLSELAISDELVAAIISSKAATPAPVPNCHFTSDTLKEFYIDNENRVNQIVPRKKKGLFHTNDALISRKSIIAQGVARDICKCYHVTDRETRDAVMHLIYASMSDSDRRWFNDVVGQIHMLITGESGNVAYKSQGLKRAYDHTTDVLKYISSHMNGGGPLMFGATVDSRGAVFAGTQYNPTWYQVRKGSVSERLVTQAREIPTMESITIEDIELLFPPLNVKEESPQTSGAKTSSIKLVKEQSIRSAQTVSSIYFDLPPQSFAKAHLPLSSIRALERNMYPQARPLAEEDYGSSNLDRKIKSILKFASMAEKKLKQTKFYKHVGIGFDLATQIRKHGVAKGSWRTLVNIGICFHPYSGTPILLSRTYDAFIPKGTCDKHQLEALQELHAYNKEHGNFFTYTLQHDLMEGYTNCLGSDALWRLPGKAADKVVDILSLTSSEENK